MFERLFKYFSNFGFFRPTAKQIHIINSHQPRHGAHFFEVSSTHQIRRQMQRVAGHGLYVIDLDETMLIADQLFGSSRWSYAYLDSLKAKISCHDTAFKKTMEKFIYAQNHTVMNLVEGQHTRQFVDHLHAQHKVIYATARGKIIADATERQLSTNGLQYNKTAPFCDLFLDLHAHVPHGLARNGVIYAHGGDKGICVERVLESVNCYDFDFIAGMDDKLDNLEDLSNAAQRLGKPFYGFRYGALDHLMDDVDLAIAEIQHEHHVKNGEFLSDQDASRLLALMRAKFQYK